jgi:hypothetical protein
VRFYELKHHLVLFFNSASRFVVHHVKVKITHVFFFGLWACRGKSCAPGWVGGVHEW